MIKAAFFLPSLLSWHGAGRWALALARHSDPSKLRWTGAAIGGFGHVDLPACREMARWMPLYSDKPSRPWPDKGIVARCKSLNEAIHCAADGAQVLLTWGSGKVLTYLNLPPIPLVMVSHTTKWWPTEGRDRIQHYAAVSEAAAVPFRRITDDVRVVPNGVEPERVVPRDPEGFRRALKIDEDKRLLGYLGRQDRNKSPELLLPFLEDPDNVLVTMGGSMSAPLLKDHPQVQHLPASPFVGDFLHAIDMLVHPATAEAFCLAIVEAWLAGTPVCCDNVGIVPEAEAKHGESLRWSLDAYLPFVTRHDRRVERARRLAWESFTAGAMADRWAGYLSSVASSPFSMSKAGIPAAKTVRWNKPVGKATEWKVGVLSSPRAEPTLERTLDSIRKAGFPEPTIYFDGADAPAVTWGDVVASEHKLGPWQSWLRMLRGLCEDAPTADVYLLCEDDVVFCKDIYPYLCRILWPNGAKVCSIYTSAYYAGQDKTRQPGFYSVSGLGIGAQAYLLPRDTAKRMLNDAKFAEGRHRFTDANVMAWAGKIHFHFPSLAEHIGNTSTIQTDKHVARMAPHRHTHRFVGEQFSAVSFLQQYGCVLPAAKRKLFPWPNEQVCVAPVVGGDRPAVVCDVVLPYDETTCPWVVESVTSLFHQVNAEPVIHLIADQVPVEMQRPIREALKEFPCIRWYETRHRLGPYRATNSIFDYMETPFYAVQDSDDLSAPHRLWRSVQVLEETGYDIFGGVVENFADYRCAGERAKRWVSVYPYHYSGDHWYKAPRGNIIHGTLTIRRSWFEKMNGYTNVRSGGDTELSARATVMGAKIFISDQICGWRRMRDRSLSYLSMARELPAGEYYPAEFSAQCEKEWKQPNCDFQKYGALDRYRDGHDVVRLERDEL